MGAYVNGVLVPPVDAGTLDGIPADLTPHGAGEDGYVVTYDNATGDLVLDQPSAGLVISAANPQPLGVAAPGTTGEVSDAGHVHLLPTSIATAQATADAAIPKSILANAGDIVVGSAAGTPAVVAAVTAGRLLRAAGANALPAYSTLTVPDTIARGSVLVATAANTVTALDAKTADTFLGGDGTDLVVRTAAQVSASLNTRSSGTLAARPVSPVAGDSYEVISGTGVGRTYQCLRAGLWTRQRSQPVPLLAVPADVTAIQPATTTVTVAAGSVTTVVASGSINASGGGSIVWPALVNQFRVQCRFQITTTDIANQNMARLYLDFNGSFNPYVMLQFGANGTLILTANWANTTLATGLSLATPLWVAVEVSGSTIRTWYCLDAGDDDSTCVWLSGATVTLTALDSKGAPLTVQVYGVAELRAAAASVTVQCIGLTVRDLTY